MQGNKCFFIGHRETPEEIYPSLYAAVYTHITEYAVTNFIVGQYGSFDRLATRAVVAAKQIFPAIRLFLLLPYHPFERPTRPPIGFDDTYYPPNMENVPRKWAIARANRSVIDHTDYLIAYVRHTASNASQLLSYAQRRSKQGFLTVFLL